MWPGGAGLGRGRMDMRRWPRPRLSAPGPPLRQWESGEEQALDFPPPPAPLPFCPHTFLRQIQSSGSPSDREVGRAVGGQRPGPGHSHRLSRAEAGFAVLGQRSRQAGAPSQQAFMRHSPIPALLSSHAPYPPDPHPTGALRNHSSFHPCPGARLPPEHPWVALWRLCPPPPLPPPPRR